MPVPTSGLTGSDLLELFPATPPDLCALWKSRAGMLSMELKAWRTHPSTLSNALLPPMGVQPVRAQPRGKKAATMGERREDQEFLLPLH